MDVAICRPQKGKLAPLAFFLQAAFLLLPGLLLLLASLRTTDSRHLYLEWGATVQIAVCCFDFLYMNCKKGVQSFGPMVITLYLIALGWFLLGTGKPDDWYSHFAEGILLLAPLSVFFIHTFINPRALIMRKAYEIAKIIAGRNDWPAELVYCADLPEIPAFRDSLHQDARPALELLKHPRPEVRAFALAALEFWPRWRGGQAEAVFQVARRETDPVLRGLAVRALAYVQDRFIQDKIAEMLNDPSRRVRRAAAESLLCDCEKHWRWLRDIVRQALGMPAHQADGPLYRHGVALSDDAVADLEQWACEKGLIGIRAAQTLGVHYRRVLRDSADPAVVHKLQERVGDRHAPAGLRLELAAILEENGFPSSDLPEELLGTSSPAALRLMAAKVLIDSDRTELATGALRDIARTPNRETALAAAAIVQRRLGIDLGLPVDQNLPSVGSRQAAEAVDRLRQWAEEHKK
jgi:hypothetical protein